MWSLTLKKPSSGPHEALQAWCVAENLAEQRLIGELLAALVSG
jgi:hypothetical protein